MAKYFGHRARWAGGTKGSSPNFGMAQGGPVAIPSTSNYGKRGQIIPPLSAGQHRPGKSLPGLTPSSMGPLAASQRAAMRGMLMRGLLGPLNWAFLLEDFMTMLEPAKVPAPFSPGPGWTRCSAPTTACTASWEPETHWGYQNSGLFGCLAYGSCPTNQAWGVPLAPGTPTAITTAVELLRMRRTSVAPERFTIFERWRRPAGDTSQSTVSRTLMPPDVLRPPLPQIRDKEYPRPETSTKPKDRFFGPRLPPTGTTKFPDYPHVPPPPNVKEKKGLVIGPGKAGKVYGALTEFRDFADCLAKSMPGNPCGRYKNQLHKYVACIAANEAAINMPEAIVCMFTNDAKDAAIGKSNRAAREAATKNPYWQRPVGPGAGGWARPRGPGKMTPI